MVIANETSTNVTSLFEYRKRKGYPEDASVLKFVIGNPDFEQYIKDIVEGMVYDMIAENRILYLERDDPFDAIYIADLKPDVIPAEDITLIQELSHRIEDRSASIFIDDEWND